MVKRYGRPLVIALVMVLALLAVAVSSAVAAPDCGCDVNRDGVVDILDLVAVSVRYGQTTAGGLPPNSPEDTNGDGQVSIDDLVCVAANYGRGGISTPLTPQPPPAQQVPCCPYLALPVDCQPAWVVRVVNGDTIDVRIGTQEVRVHLLGIDAPEGGESCALQAKQFTEMLMANQAVCLESERNSADRDSYGRLLRYVWVGGRMAQAEMLYVGMARVFNSEEHLGPKKYAIELNNIESEARAARRGVWGTTCSAR